MHALKTRVSLCHCQSGVISERKMVRLLLHGCNAANKKTLAEGAAGHYPCTCLRTGPSGQDAVGARVAAASCDKDMPVVVSGHVAVAEAVAPEV